MIIINTKEKKFETKFKTLLDKRRIKSKLNSKKVSKILFDVKTKGDRSLIFYTRKYDKVNLNLKNIRISNSEISNSISKLDKKIKKSIDVAYARITKFHLNQKLKGFSYIDSHGNKLGYRLTPLNSVGIYVPGGTASYPSTLIMNAVPAIVAGVKNIFCTIPSSLGKINSGVLYAAKKCKIKSIFQVGGAQAIGALTYGTKTIPKVDKIVGPGNVYVTTAKKEVYGEVGIDMIAGPSEVTVVADKNNKPDWTAIDLLSQAEHDIFSQSILITTDKRFGTEVKKNIQKILKFLPRSKIAGSSIKNFGAIIVCKNKNEIINLVNKIAPEHLQIKMKNPEQIAKKIFSAGSIFLGKYSPEAIGDYIAGPNHVLPTSGSARFSSGLSVTDFYKKTSLIKCSKSGVEKIAQFAINLARYEKLDAHAISIEKRLKN